MNIKPEIKFESLQHITNETLENVHKSFLPVLRIQFSKPDSLKIHHSHTESELNHLTCSLAKGMWSADTSRTSKNTCLFLFVHYHLHHYLQNVPGLVCFKVRDMLNRFNFHQSSHWRPTPIRPQACTWAQPWPEQQPREVKSKLTTHRPMSQINAY